MLAKRPSWPKCASCRPTALYAAGSWRSSSACWLQPVGAIRGGAAGAWATQFNLTHEQVGWVNGAAFWGFTLAMVFGGPLCDAIGLGRIVGIAFVGHIAGILLTTETIIVEKPEPEKSSPQMGGGGMGGGMPPY